ncbi:MAG: site-specific integrase [Actinobacteria bacterium]|nr:site-specific integrase [Actinomycetota bacterium]
MKAGSAYQNRDLVFATGCGTPINLSNLRNRSLSPLLKKAGLPQISFHDLRHTTASLLFSKNVHPKFVQELLGHASVAITLDIYSHIKKASSRPLVYRDKNKGRSPDRRLRRAVSYQPSPIPKSRRRHVVSSYCS